MRTAILAALAAIAALGVSAQAFVTPEPVLFLAVWPLAALVGFLAPPRGFWVPAGALAGGLAGIAFRLQTNLSWEALVFATAACLPLLALAAARARPRDERLVAVPVFTGAYVLAVWVFAISG